MNQPASHRHSPHQQRAYPQRRQLWQLMWWWLLGVLLAACSGDTAVTLELDAPSSLVVGETVTVTARWTGGTGADRVTWQILPAGSVRIDTRDDARDDASNTNNQQATLQITALEPRPIIIQATLNEASGTQRQQQRSLTIRERANFEGADAPTSNGNDTDGNDGDGNDSDDSDDAFTITPVASLTVDALADRYFSVPARGFAQGFSQQRLNAFETALRQAEREVTMCVFNATNAEVIAGACADADAPITFSNPTREVFAPGRPVLELDVDPAAYAALHVLAYVSDVSEPALQGYALNLGDSSQNNGFGGSDGERDNAEVLWYAPDDSQLSLFSRADTPSELVRVDLLEADRTALRAAVLHLMVTPDTAGSRLLWRCVGAVAAPACDGQFRTADLEPAQLFALGAGAANNQLWLALNRVIAPETSATSSRLGSGISHGVVWLEPRPLPDLVVQDITFNETSTSETPRGCTLDITIANIGQGDANGNFAFRADPITIIGTTSNVAWSNAIYGLAAGQQVQQRWHNVRVNSNTVTVTVNPDNTLTESDNSAASNTLTRPVPAACQGDNGSQPNGRINKRLEGNLQAGATARYVIDVRFEDAPSSVPTVIDTLPVGMQFVASPSSAWSCQAAVDRQVRCDYQAALPTTAATLEPLLLEVRLERTLTGSVRNCARLEMLDREPSEACVSHEVNRSSSDLRLSQALRGSLREGRLSQVVVQVANLGPDALAGNVQVTSTLPQGITFLADNSPTWRCRLGSAQAQAQQVICDYQGNRPVEVDSLADIVYTIEVGNSAADSVTLCSSVSADADSNPINNRSCGTFFVQRDGNPSSDLSLSKSVSGELTRGELGRYVLRVSNLGPAAYSGTLRVTDDLPVGVRFVEARSRGQVWRCDSTPNDISESISCRYVNDIDAISVGALADVTLVVEVASDAPDGLENCAALQLEPPDTNPDNNRACVRRDLGQPAPSGFDVAVSQAIIGSVQAGAVSATNVQVANLGSTPVNVPVQLISDLPASVRFVSSDTGNVSDTADGVPQRWTCDAQAQRLECTLTAPAAGWDVGSLPPLNVVFELTEDAPARLELCFAVSATGDNNPANNQDCRPLTVQAAEPEPYDLQLDITLRGELRRGQNVRYTVQVSNLGPGSATDPLRLETTLAPDLRVTALELNNLWRCQSDGANPETITCLADTPPFAVGSVPPLELNALVMTTRTSGDTLTTCATIQAAGDSNPDNNRACASGILQARRADVQLSSNVVNTPTPGGRLSLVLAVRNAGPDNVTGVRVTTPLPVGFRFITASAPWSCAASRSNVRCSLNEALAVGDAPPLTLELAISADTSGVVTSCSSVTFNQDDISDPNLANNDACQDLRVAAANDLAINKTLEGNLQRGAAATYTITVSHLVSDLNNQAVSNVPDVIDTLPTGLELDFVDSDDWTCALVVNTLSCRFTADTLAAGASSRLAIITRVRQDAPDSIENCAELSLLDQDASNNRSCVSAAVTRARDLAVALELAGPWRAPGQNRYRVTVSRNPDDLDGDGLDDSSDALAPVTVSVSLPSDMELISGATFGAWTCAEQTDNLSCTFIPADGGAIPGLELPVRLSANPSSPLEVCAELAPDRDASNNRACLESNVNPAAVLTLEKTLLESLDVGSESQYRLSASVRLPEDVADALDSSTEAIILRDDLPRGVQLVSADSSFWNCSQTASASGSQVNCLSRVSLGELLDDIDDDDDDDNDDDDDDDEDDVVLVLEPLVLSVRVNEDAPANLENCAELQVLGVTERRCIRNPVGRRFDLTIRKSLPETVLEVGSSYAYRIEVENLGPNSAPAPVTVRDVLPLGVRFRNTPDGLNWTCSSSSSNRDTVTCSYSGSTSVGTFTNLLLIVDVTADALAGSAGSNSAVLENCAEVIATGESSSSNNRACISNRVIR